MLILFLVSLSVFSLFVGAIDIDIKNLFQEEINVRIFLLSRLPRLMAILCTGIGMSIAGLIMQQLCMNKFVSPTTGATIQSAQFGIMLTLVAMPFATMWQKTMIAFVTAILGTWIFVWFIQKMKFKDGVMVPLVGIMFGNVIGGLTSFFAYKFEVTQQLSSYLVGSFSLVIKGNYELVYLVVPLIILAFLYADHFNIVALGKNLSENLGVNHKWIVFLGLTLASMITASVVSIVGQISYIGLIVPNLITLFKGDKIKGTLVDTALFGAIFVLFSDVIARSILMPYELPIELVIGIVGSIVFILLVFYRLRFGKKKMSIKYLFQKERRANQCKEGVS